jgi:hypothetical protein
MVGSVVLARAVGDKRLSDTLLQAGRHALRDHRPRATTRERVEATKLSSTGAARVNEPVIANVER